MKIADPSGVSAAVVGPVARAASDTATAPASSL
jgi:hypothetical protein